jgi:hypothetical protein
MALQAQAATGESGIQLIQPALDDRIRDVQGRSQLRSRDRLGSNKQDCLQFYRKWQFDTDIWL